MRLIPTEHCILEPMNKAPTTYFTFNMAYPMLFIQFILIFVAAFRPDIKDKTNCSKECDKIAILPQQIGLLFYVRVLCIVVQIHLNLV